MTSGVHADQKGHMKCTPARRNKTYTGHWRPSIVELKAALSELETTIALLEIAPGAKRNEIMRDARICIEKVIEKIKRQIGSA